MESLEDDAQLSAARCAGDGPLLVFFTASWCAPCKRLYPAFEGLAASSDWNHVRFAVADVDALEEAVDELDISLLPCFIVFDADRGGKAVDRVAGAAHKRPGRRILQLLQRVERGGAGEESAGGITATKADDGTVEAKSEPQRTTACTAPSTNAFAALAAGDDGTDSSSDSDGD